MQETDEEKVCVRKVIFNGRPLILRGVYVSFWRDLYFFFLSSRWATLMMTLASFYIAMNSLFAGLYILGGDCILNAKPGSWWDAFFFSVQTWATIGYGSMAPKTHYADILVAVESFSGLMSMSLVTGLVFAKFAKPSAKVRFTDKILISRFDGKRVLMLRLGNMRANQIAEARIKVIYTSEQRTLEGQIFRRLEDLKLLRDSNSLFTLSWQVIHVIDESSPFYKGSPSEFRDKKVQIVVAISGTDEQMNQTIHARKVYSHEDILWEHRFEDILSEQAGTSVIDYTKFDRTVPL